MVALTASARSSRSASGSPSMTCSSRRSPAKGAPCPTVSARRQGLGRDRVAVLLDRLAQLAGAVEVQADPLLDPQARRPPRALDRVDDLARERVAAQLGVISVASPTARAASCPTA